MAVPSDELQKRATVKSKLEDVISISFLVTLTKCLTETREGRVSWPESSAPRRKKHVVQKCLLQEAEMEKDILDLVQPSKA